MHWHLCVCVKPFLKVMLHMSRVCCFSVWWLSKSVLESHASHVLCLLFLRVFFCVFSFLCASLCSIHQVSMRLLPFRSEATWQLRPTKESRSAAAFLLAMESPKMTDFLLRFRDVTGGLQDCLRESPFAASLQEPRVDFFWRAKSVRPIQTILGTAEQICR